MGPEADWSEYGVNLIALLRDVYVCYSHVGHFVCIAHMWGDIIFSVSKVWLIGVVLLSMFSPRGVAARLSLGIRIFLKILGRISYP